MIYIYDIYILKSGYLHGEKKTKDPKRQGIQTGLFKSSHARHLPFDYRYNYIYIVHIRTLTLSVLFSVSRTVTHQGPRKCIWIDILTYTVPRFDNTVEIGGLKRSSSTPWSLKHYTTGLAKSSTSMLNKGDAIVNVKIDVTIQHLEKEYEIFYPSVV